MLQPDPNKRLTSSQYQFRSDGPLPGDFGHLGNREIRTFRCAHKLLDTFTFVKILPEQGTRINEFIYFEKNQIRRLVQSWTKVVVTPTPSPRIQCCHVVNSGFNINLGDGVLQHWYWGAGCYNTFLQVCLAIDLPQIIDWFCFMQ